MRRAEKEIKDKTQIDAMLAEGHIGRLEKRERAVI